MKSFFDLTREQQFNWMVVANSLYEPKHGIDWADVTNVVGQLNQGAAEQNITLNLKLVFGLSVQYDIHRSQREIMISIDDADKIAVHITIDADDPRFSGDDVSLLRSLQKDPLALDLSVDKKFQRLNIKVLQSDAIPFAGTMFVDVFYKLGPIRYHGGVRYWADQVHPAPFVEWVSGLVIGLCLAHPDQFSTVSVVNGESIAYSVYGKMFARDNQFALMVHKPWAGKLSVRIPEQRVQQGFVVLASIYDHFGYVVTVSSSQVLRVLQEVRGIRRGQELSKCLDSLSDLAEAGYLDREKVGDEIVFHPTQKLLEAVK